jgi:hypothetical protein
MPPPARHSRNPMKKGTASPVMGPHSPRSATRRRIAQRNISSSSRACLSLRSADARRLGPPNGSDRAVVAQAQPVHSQFGGRVTLMTAGPALKRPLPRPGPPPSSARSGPGWRPGAPAGPRTGAGGVTGITPSGARGGTTATPHRAGRPRWGGPRRSTGCRRLAGPHPRATPRQRAGEDPVAVRCSISSTRGGAYSPRRVDAVSRSVRASATGRDIALQRSGADCPARWHRPDHSVT